MYFLNDPLFYECFHFIQAEAVAIIIDVSPPMNEAPDGEETPLQKCITAANMIVQRKVSF